MNSQLKTDDAECALGIDIGGTNTVFGICSQQGEILYESSVHTRTVLSPEGLAKSIHDHLEEKNLLNCIRAIGIGAPNGNNLSSTIEFAPNLPWKGIIPLGEIFENAFGVPVSLTNDANAAALGEMVFGNAQDLKHFVTITLGTGLGSGIIVNGELIYGHDGFAGEYGHIQVIPDGRLCGCGRKGCLETYVSATGVVRSIAELQSVSKATSVLIEKNVTSAREIFEYADAGDQFAQEIIDYTAEILGKSLANFACFSSPKAFVLFGGIAQSGEKFASKVKEHMEANMLNIYKNKVEIRISSLHNVNAAVLGSASLVWSK
ncbi:MAG: glucokinase [Bacteroidetes bacterium]|nr:MAG: glucokinase [Bacteroidota bacterium]